MKNINLLQQNLDQEISNHNQEEVIAYDQLELIEKYLSEVKQGIGYSSFEEYQEIVALQNVHGKLAIENNEKVIDIT